VRGLSKTVTLRQRPKGRPRTWRERLRRACPLCWKRVQRLLLDDVSFSLQAGEVFALLGGNGSGKSTLLRILATLITPDSGEAVICGRHLIQEAHDVRKIVRRVGVRPGLIPGLSVEQNLLLAAMMYDVPTAPAVERAIADLQTLGLSEDCIEQPAKELSCGQQEMVAICREVSLRPPRVLLLDEPTGHLDREARRTLAAWLRRLCQDTGMTVILVTHSIRFVASLADRVGVLRDGRLIACGTVAELSKRHGDGAFEPAYERLTRRALAVS